VGGSGRPAPPPQVVDHFREGVVVCDASGLVLDLNDVARRLLPGIVIGGTAPDLGQGELTRDDRRLRTRRVWLGGGRVAWYVEDVTDAVARDDALLADHARARFLAGASQRLGNPLHEDRAARAAARLAVPTLGDIVVVVLAARRSRVKWWRARADGDTPVVDGGLLEFEDLPPPIAEALAGGEPSEVDWLADQIAEAGWLGALRPGAVSVRIVPLPGSAAPTGALLVVRANGRGFDEHDTQTLRGFAARAGAALDAAVLYREQAEVAETLQSSLAPVEPPEVAGVQWGAAYRPAQTSLRIGGDFYGAHRLADGGALFYLGDVSGKGVDAAIFTGQIRQGLQALRGVETEPSRLLGLLNGSVLETTRAGGHGRFATMVLGRAHQATGGGGGLMLNLASGGHLPPLILRADGYVETVDLRGMLVGVVPDPRIGSASVQLAAGETCLLFSDGVTEARGGPHGDQYGVTRLMDDLAGCHRMPAPAVAERVAQLVGDWLGGREHDDIAVLALRAVSPGAAVRHLHAVPGTPS
jgi:serine phosphatase RsbU (regulator of sigma subunit)